MAKIREWPLFKKFPEQKMVCGQILKLLDREGRCSSVVNIQNDVEGNWDENTFQLLGRTTLLDHSLNVAEQVVQLLSDADDWHVIPDTMVAALGHDLGKIESARGYLYSTGEHAVAAGRPLGGIAGFNELRRKDEILQAIKLHHKKPQGLIGKTLKLADQKARQKELEEAALKIDVKKANEIDGIPAPDRKQLEVKSAAIRQAQQDIYNENEGVDRKRGNQRNRSLWIFRAGLTQQVFWMN